MPAASNGAPTAVIIGCGRIAGGYNDRDDREPLTHVVAYRQARAVVSGCCDRDAERARAFAERWGIALWGTDAADVLHHAHPDVVSVCTYPAERGALVDQIVRSSARAVLIEKPLAASGAEAVRIHDCLRAWGRPALVNYLRAFDPWYQRLQEDVEQGTFGRLREITGRYYDDAATNAAHLLERVLAMCGTPATVRRLSGSAKAPLFELQWHGGLVARFLPAEGFEWSPFEFDLLFGASRVRVIDSEERTEWFTAQAHPRFPEFANLQRDRRRDETGPSVGAMTHVVRALLNASRSGHWDDSLLARAVAVSEILEQIGC